MISLKARLKLGLFQIVLCTTVYTQALQNTSTQPLLIDPRTRYQNHSQILPPSTWPLLETTFVQAPDHGETTYRGSGRLAGRHALITGGDSGIGRSVAIAYAREGAKVAINYLPAEEADAQSLDDLLIQEGRSIVRISGDLRNESFCRSLVEEAHRELGGLDIVVSNAGYPGHQAGPEHADISSLTTAEFDQIMQTNIYASFFIARAAVPLMPPGSNIIYTASDSSLTPMPDLLPYASSKAFITYWATALARQVFNRGIRVNAVQPGVVFTAFLGSGGFTTAALRALEEMLPTGRVAQPAELAPVYVDIADPQASFASGGVWVSHGA